MLPKTVDRSNFVRGARGPRRVPQTLAPDLRPAEERARRGPGAPPGPLATPRRRSTSQASISANSRPAPERPAVSTQIWTSARLAHDDVAVAGGVAVARAVARRTRRRGRRPGARARGCACRCRRRSRSGGRSGSRSWHGRPANVVEARDDRQVAQTPSASSAGSMKNPNPSLTTSTARPAAWAAGRTARSRDRAAGRPRSRAATTRRPVGARSPAPSAAASR